MARPFQVTIDAVDPARLAAFWAAALDYEVQPPPAGFASWEEFLGAQGVPREQWGTASAITDPDGVRPRIFFQRVPEPKRAKNRVHLDLQSGGGPGVPVERQRGAVRAEVDRLVALGATEVSEHADLGVVWVVMRDPEGNEFCA
ncbi:MAG: VOC family protein [Mycobacteriales bacterium]